MIGKRVQFDEETWQALDLLAKDTVSSFQELADEAFHDLLKKTSSALVAQRGATRKHTARGPMMLVALRNHRPKTSPSSQPGALTGHLASPKAGAAGVLVKSVRRGIAHTRRLVASTGVFTPKLQACKYRPCRRYPRRAVITPLRPAPFECTSATRHSCEGRPRYRQSR